MIKALQKRFVVTAMAAVSVLLLLLLGTINIVNITIVRNETDKTLTIISEAEGDFGRVPMPPTPAPPPDFRVEPKDKRDKFLSSNFFVVRFAANGQAVYTDVSRTSMLDEKEAVQLASETLAYDESSGKVGKYRYRISTSPMGNEMITVFLDTSEEILSYVRVLLLSGGIGIVCWFMMLLLVIFLSKRAIRPIAENIEKQKQFVTNAGHEIKTPLAIILANTEAMELLNGQNKWSKNIREQTVRLSGLMQNLLLLAKMDEHTSKVEVSDFCLSELLAESIGAYAEPLKLRNIALQSEIHPDITVTANKEQILQLISILLDNAVKYTNEDGTVFVILQKNEHHIKMQIKNTCDKIPDVTPEKLFDRFYREDKARTQKAGGYGIGLSIAQSIAEANNGSIAAAYEMPNTIAFTLKFK